VVGVVSIIILVFGFLIIVCVVLEFLYATFSLEFFPLPLIYMYIEMLLNLNVNDIVVTAVYTKLSVDQGQKTG
jgi:hypothetical protein